MEYVQGDPLDVYCDLRRLHLRARLEIFLSVCAAVHFAHQRLVIHRDLKPVNVLVTDEGEPKLLDFGIATLLDPYAVAPVACDSDQAWTREFASPEQLRSEPLTTASDVYSLGIILHWLLTGLPVVRYPLETKDGEQGGSDPAIKGKAKLASNVVKDAQRDPDQAKLIQLLADARALCPRRLARALRGDLDAILSRALQQDSEKRYSSVEEFSADIRRYLRHDAVRARKGNWCYVSGRFIRRHLISLGVTTAFGVSVVGSASMLWMQNQRISAERERAETVSQFMLNVFSAADPFVSRGRETTARELLQQAGERIRLEPKMHPAAKAQLLEGIGRAYRRQEQPDKSLSYLIQSLAIRQAQLPFDPVRIARIQTELAVAYRAAGQFSESDAVFQEAARLVSAEREGSAEHIRLLVEMGRLELFRGEVREAERRFIRALSLAQRVFGTHHPEFAVILLDMANAASWRDAPATAVRCARRAVMLLDAALPALHPDYVMAQHILADAYFYSGQIELAKALYEKVLPAQKRLYGPYAPKIADTLDALASVHRSLGNLREAERYARDAIATQEASLGLEHYMAGYYYVSLALVLLERGGLEEAESYLRRGLEIYERTLEPDHDYVTAAKHWLGETMIKAGQFARAQSELEQVIHMLTRSGAGDWRVARSESALGEALWKLGKVADAERLLSKSYEALTSAETADSKVLTAARERLEQFYRARGASKQSITAKPTPVLMKPSKPSSAAHSMC
jgi:tetratricopeptide (TPR) repeat protein